MMNDMSGINNLTTPRWGLNLLSSLSPRALPWAVLCRPVGAENWNELDEKYTLCGQPKSKMKRVIESRTLPRTKLLRLCAAEKENKTVKEIDMEFNVKAPTGRSIKAQGNALGY
jgi:hypothetical protein